MFIVIDKVDLDDSKKKFKTTDHIGIMISAMHGRNGTQVMLNLQINSDFQNCLPPHATVNRSILLNENVQSEEQTIGLRHNPCIV